MKKQISIMLVILVVVLGVGWLLMQSSDNTPNNQSSSDPLDINQLISSNTQMTGSINAKVNIVEFGDYECPACGLVEPALERIISEYKNNPDFNFAFRHFPLPQHRAAVPAAHAAEAAGKQNKFWEMHQKIYNNQSEWSNKNNASEIFEKYAQELGLNVEQFKSDVISSSVEDKTQNDLRAADTLGLNQTPTIFINGQKLNYLPTYDQLKKQVDDLLQS
jgi:protein-disulfide isomerase